MAGKDHEKKFDLWPLTLMGQINQAQNANLKMANLSWVLLETITFNFFRGMNRDYENYEGYAWYSY